jgi:hypothetical protein
LHLFSHGRITIAVRTSSSNRFAGFEWAEHEMGTIFSNSGYFAMERDFYDAAIEEILSAADGDVRRALREVLKENVQLEAELRQLYAVSARGKPADPKNSLH